MISSSSSLSSSSKNCFQTKNKLKLFLLHMNKLIISLSFYLFILLIFNMFNITSALSISFLDHNQNNINKRQNLIEENYLFLRSSNQSNYLSFNNDTSSYESILPPMTITTQVYSSVYSLPTKIILSTLATITSLVTIGGNMLVMCSFFLDRQIRNPTNYFLLSLSVSDFLIGLFSMPLYTLYLMLGVWPFGEVICNLWLSLDYTVCLTSIYTVLFITVDRFCSVKLPAKYRKWRTRQKVVAMVACTWVIPISLFFTSIFAWTYSNPERVFDPYNCDVGWANDKWFNIFLVIAYFWTTLVVMIILYIFIYQVASNLERKSRAKQRKMSSLVGASNAGALVAGVVGAYNVNRKLTKKTTPDTLVKQTDDEENYNTDAQSKASKASIKKLKNFKNKSIKYVEIEADKKTKQNNNNNNTAETSPTNNNTNSNVNFKPKEDSGIDVDKNFMDKDSTQNNEGNSSSFESHSDYDSNSNGNKMQFKNKGFRLSTKEIQTKLKEIPLVAAVHDDPNSNVSSALEPRPEKLAIMSVDSFTEKCHNKQVIGKNAAPEQIPFIDEEFDELSYILHKRQVDKDGKLLVREETIIIKSPFKQSFMQRLQSPLKSFNRKSSAKSRTSIEINTKIVDNNENQKKLKNINLISLETGPIANDKETTTTTIPTQKQPLQPATPINKIETTKLCTTNTTTLTRSISNSNSDSNTDSNTNIYSSKKGDKSKILDKNTNLKKKPSQTNEYDSEDNFESAMSKSHSNCLNTNGGSFKEKPNSNNSNKTSLIGKLKQKNNFKAINNNISNLTTKRNGNTEGIVMDLEQAERNKRKLKYENRARKALRTITFILGAFVFCFAPWHVVSVWNSFCDKCLTNHKYLSHIFNICYWLCYLNSPINPFMYALANQQFRKTFYRILKRDWRRL